LRRWPVHDPALNTLSLSGGWAAHAADFDRAWAQLDRRQLQTIQSWAPRALGDLYAESSPVFYFFSGPDFLYAREFFPNAATYVLCGIEPIGPVPHVEDIQPETLNASLCSLRQSLDTLLDFSFFITKKMRVQLQDRQDNRLSGTLPLLYVFLARSGCHIRDVSLIGLDATGHFTSGKSLAPAVKIDFTGPGGKDQTLYYFSTNLSDDTIGTSGFLSWCAGLGPSHGFLKAASYLMHTGGFEIARQFLLTHCAAILQDDSGIPMRYFPREDWAVRLCGAYHGPIATFKQFPQPELDQLTALQKPAALPFSVGYRWHPGESSLIFAVKATHGASP